MDRISGFGPVGGGSIPPRPVQDFCSDFLNFPAMSSFHYFFQRNNVFNFGIVYIFYS